MEKYSRISPYWLNRREFLGQFSEGLTSIALALLLKEQGLLAEETLSLREASLPSQGQTGDSDFLSRCRLTDGYF